MCVALARCSHAPVVTSNDTDALEQHNRNLLQQVSDQELEVRRLTRFLEKEPVREPEPVAEDPKLPLTKLRPEVEKKVGDPDDESYFDDSQAVASSSFEVMTFYQTGRHLYQAGKYDEAVSSFKLFLEREPEHVYADRAQYWIADSYFRNREYGLAVVASNLLVSRYPYSVRVPEALFRSALCHVEMGSRKEARVLLRDLLRQFPLDATAKSASRKLAEISNTDQG